MPISESKRLYDKQWWKDNPERAKAYRVSRKEKDKAYGKVYRAEHKVEKAVASKIYDLAHSEARRENRIKNKEGADESRRNYAASEKGKLKNYLRQIQRRAIGIIPKEVFEEVVNEYAGVCPYCNKHITNNGTLDHIIPISKGGTNDRYNLVWVCRSCNSSKHNTPLILWLVRRNISNGIK